MFPSITNFIIASDSLSRALYFFTTVFPILVLLASLAYVWKRPRMEKGMFAPIERIVDRSSELFRISLTLVAVWIAAALLKTATHVSRPFLVDVHLHPLFLLHDFSFPSQHAAIFAALAVLLFAMNRRAGVFAGSAALLIGIARILAGVHTPLDIMGGYVLGFIFAYFVIRISRLQKQ